MNRLIFIGYAAFVAFASLRTASGASLEPWDKLLHLITYCIFALLGYQVARKNRDYLYLCLGIIAYGGLMEIGQSFIPGRVMSLPDLLANALGVALGAIIAKRLLCRKTTRDSKRPG